MLRSEDGRAGASVVATAPVIPALADRRCLRLLLSNEQGDCGTWAVCCTAPGCTAVGENILFDCTLVPTGIITLRRHCVLGSEDHTRAISLSSANDKQNDQAVGRTLFDCLAVPKCLQLVILGVSCSTRDCKKLLAPWSTVDQTEGLSLRGDSVAMCFCELSAQVPAQLLLLGHACPGSGLNFCQFGCRLVIVHMP